MGSTTYMGSLIVGEHGGSLESGERLGVIDRRLVGLILIVLGACGFILRIHNLGRVRARCR